MTLKNNYLHRPIFDRSKLPDPQAYYSKELGPLKIRGHWGLALCCFHHEHHPSLSVNLQQGFFKCFACGASGGDVLAFQMRRYGQDFITAAEALGAMENCP